MLVYIIKSIACLALFFVFYKVFLEKENMHVFKRFYLLGSLLLSIIIPALVFTEYVEVPTVTATYSTIQQVTTNEVIGVPPVLKADVLDIEPILWTIYFLGLLFFGLKFIRNLFQIFGRIRGNPKQRLERFTQVLLQEQMVPHTFFSYIFLNKKKLESNEIPKEVLLHEETHAQQKHSWDVVLVELLHVLFWVNPFIYFTKKAIKLNHEFLADQAVLKKDIDKTTYQNTLLSYLSPDSKEKYQPLANSINYSSIKKRFTIMKTHTSKKAMMFRSLLLLPLLATMLYGFSETKVELISSSSNDREKVEISEKNGSIKLVMEYNRLAKSHNLFADYGLRSSESEIRRLKHIYGLMSEEQKNEAEIFPEYPLKKSQDSISLKLIFKFNKKGQLFLNNEIVDEKGLLKKLNDTDFSNESKSAEVLVYAKNASEDDITQLVHILKSFEIEKMGIVNEEQEHDGATEEQLAEYDALAKKYNTMLSKSKSIQIKMKDVNRLNYIYGLMSEKQKAAAEPFPDFPEPPPPPKAPKSPRVKKGEESDIPPPPPASRPSEVAFAGKAIEEIIANQDPYDYGPLPRKVLKGEKIPSPFLKYADRMNIYRGGKNEIFAINIAKPQSPINPKKLEITNSIQQVKEEMQRIEYTNGTTDKDILKPPTPPEPKSPLDFAIEMAKKDAIFYFKGKEITSDKAIELLKKNKDLNMDARASNGKRPIVKLSEDPIVIEN